MFSLNTVALDNATFGWSVMSTSKPQVGITRRSGALAIPGRDGLVPVHADENAPTIALVIRADEDTADSLFALLDADPLLLGDGARTATVELLSAVPDPVLEDGRYWVYVTAVVRFNGNFWRDPSDTTSSAASLSSASIVNDVLADLSAPVQDAIVRVKGSATGLVVTDSRGTSFAYATALGSGDYLRFESATRRAFVTASNVWTGGTEVTGQIVTGRWPFEITPFFTDPATRVGRLTVATATRSGATIEVRGRRAYRL